MKTLLTLIVTLISASYVSYGAVVVVSNNTSLLTVIYGMVALAYGMLVFTALVYALRKSRLSLNLWVNILGLVFFILFIMVAVDSGIVSGHELSGFVTAALPIVINAISIKKIAAL